MSDKVVSLLLKPKAMVVVRKILGWSKAFGIIVVGERSLLALAEALCDILKRKHIDCVQVDIKDLRLVISEHRIVIVCCGVVNWDDIRRYIGKSRFKLIFLVCCSPRDVPTDLRNNVIAYVRLSDKEFEKLIRRASRIFISHLVSDGVDRIIARMLVRSMMSYLRAKGKLHSFGDLLYAWKRILEVARSSSKVLVSPADALADVFMLVYSKFFSCGAAKNVVIERISAEASEVISVKYASDGRKYRMLIPIYSLGSIASSLDKPASIITYSGDDWLAIDEVLSFVRYLIDRKKLFVPCPIRSDGLTILRCVKQREDQSLIQNFIHPYLVKAFLFLSIMVDLYGRGVLSAEYVVVAYTLYVLILISLTPLPEAVWERINDLLRGIIAKILVVDYFLARKILESLLARLSREGLRFGAEVSGDIIMRWGELVESLVNEVKFRLELVA